MEQFDLRQTLNDREIAVKNLCLFVDPNAKGIEKQVFRFCTQDKNGNVLFLNNLKIESKEAIQSFLRMHKSPATTSAVLTMQGAVMSVDVIKKTKPTHRLVDFFGERVRGVNGINFDALSAIKPLLNEESVTYQDLMLYEQLFVCTQLRELKNDRAQMKLSDFEM